MRTPVYTEAPKSREYVFRCARAALPRSSREKTHSEHTLRPALEAKCLRAPFSVPCLHTKHCYTGLDEGAVPMGGHPGTGVHRETRG